VTIPQAVILDLDGTLIDSAAGQPAPTTLPHELAARFMQIDDYCHLPQMFDARSIAL
jgi:beta-phosphoglucomutase-like phosphatase (HAD superfamily)